jgi:cell fate regulator YaaT (PSP1 superfamily)
MPTVVSVAFREAGRAYYFDPGDLQVKEGDRVLAETARGLELGTVVGGRQEVAEADIPQPLKPLVRVATAADIERDAENRELEKQAMAICAEKIRAHGLAMKLIECDYTFDRSRVVFFFGAEGRVDFRKLVRDLASALKTRIELRQVGVRDEAKLMGDVGPCGRELCCATFLTTFDPVAIRMAKEQGLSLNPAKISGVCGRLMCCLRYEHDFYQEKRRELPRVGSWVVTDRGEGKVTDVNVLTQRVVVQVPDYGQLEAPASAVRPAPKRDDRPEDRTRQQ